MSIYRPLYSINNVEEKPISNMLLELMFDCSLRACIAMFDCLLPRKVIRLLACPLAITLYSLACLLNRSLLQLYARLAHCI